MICHSCHKELQFKVPISRTEECPSCGADIHCCLNCMNYDPAAHNRCREPQAEWVTDRERSNFCDFFSPAGKGSFAAQKKTEAGEARRAFDDLFKK